MSLEDSIPAHLLHRTKFQEFVKWLAGVPIDFDNARATMRRWARVTGFTMDRDHWAIFETEWIQRRAAN